MIRVALGFARGIQTLHKAWWAWIGLLMLVNLVGPWFFLETTEARVVLAAFLLAVVIQMGLFASRGFVRLLGIGHAIPWLPMLLWLGGRLDQIGTATAFGKWLLAVVLLDGLSLAIDLVDVGRYALGDREPSYRLE